MTLLTEKEAAEKWCPMYRYALADGHKQTNRPIADTIPFCIGSRCMAWRWTRDSMVFDILEGHGAVFRQQKVDDPIYGFCGAFGKP